MVIFTTFSFILPVWPVKKRERSWRMLINYGELNPVMIPVATGIPNEVSFLGKQIQSLVPSMQLLIWLIPLSLIVKTTKNSFLSTGRISNILHYLISSLYQLYSPLA